MNILFLGGTGNISSDCVDRALADGHHVSVLHRGRRPAPARCDEILADHNHRDAVRRAVRHRTFDVLINFIGYAPADLEIDYSLFKDRIAQYIFISTAMVYAKPHTQLPLTETAPKGNIYSDYAAKKLKCEEGLLKQYRTCGFPCTIVRPSHTYSKRWIPNIVSSRGYTAAARLEQGKPLFVPDDGNIPWALTATTDFAAGLTGLIGSSGAIGECFHITTDEALTWNEIYAELAAAVGVDNPDIVSIPTDFICTHFPQLEGSLRGDKVNPGVFDNRKIKSFVPGFRCAKSFREGVREAVAYLRAHPQEQHINTDVDTTFDAVIQAWRSQPKRT